MINIAWKPCQYLWHASQYVLSIACKVHSFSPDQVISLILLNTYIDSFCKFHTFPSSISIPIPKACGMTRISEKMIAASKSKRFKG